MAALWKNGTEVARLERAFTGSTTGTKYRKVYSVRSTGAVLTKTVGEHYQGTWKVSFSAAKSRKLGATPDGYVQRLLSLGYRRVSA